MPDTPRPPTGAWRTYLELATGLGETSRKQVRRVVKDLVGKGNATAEQLKGATIELLAANATNREALGKLVKVEVDRALGRVGLATMDEVNELTARVRDLERQLREARAGAAGATSNGAGKPATARVVKKTGTPAKAASATKAGGKATRAAAPSRATSATTRRTTTGRGAAAKSPAKATTKATATKAAPARATARKAAPAKAAGARRTPAAARTSPRATARRAAT